MTIVRLKGFIYTTLVPEGYNMSFKHPTVQDLDTLIEIANSAKEELLVADNGLQDFEDKEMMESLLFKLNKVIEDDADWEDKYDKCWGIKDKMFEYTHFSWYDPDTSYEEDVLAFYQAAKDHIECM